ncbi:MAG: hypothetical protein WCB58_05790 [Acidobacteriaceae bacterium]
MKLRLQCADMLPASTKPGPEDFHGKGAFGTAMEEVMAASASGLPLRAETPNALLRKQAQIGSYPGTAESEEAIDDLSEDTHVPQEVLAPKIQAGGKFAHPAEQSELTSTQGSQNPDSKAYSVKVSPLLEQRPPERMREDPINQASHRQSPVVQELHAKSHDIALMKGSSSRAIHKAETMGNAPTHPVVGQAAGVPPVVSQPIDGVMGVMAMPRLQPAGPGSQSDGSQPLQSSSTALGGQVRGQRAMALSHGDLRGTSLAAPAQLTAAQLPKTAAGPGGKISEPVPADTNPVSLTKPHASSPSIGRAHTDGVVAPNQAFRPQAAHVAVSDDATAQQTDARALNTEKKIETAEVKSDVKTGGAGYPAPMPPLVQHPTLPNVAPTVIHTAEKSMAMHRPETSATQVLQKMDFAGPSGPVQLRMDARRLDVGVSSGALGWVEVRATTGASGRVDATVHVQNDASAQVLSNQSREISEYAREHSVQLGEVSVGVGTGDNAQSQSRSTNTPDGNGTRVRRSERPLADAEQTHYAGEAVSLISVRA